MKKTVGTFIVLFATVLVIGGAWAQPLPTAKPEQVGMSSERLARLGPALKAQIANDRFPGAVVLVARKGKVVYFETVGQRDPATGAPMTKDAIFRLYSMTKPFTSVAAMVLVEEGKLLLADPVSKYFPELANPQVALKETTDGKTTYRLVPAERPITIQDLLRHTSGFAYANNTLNDQVKAAYGTIGVDWRDVTPTEQIQRLAQAPLAHHPGTMWEYSLSTDVLGRVVEKVSGMTLSAFLTERLFGPLKMADTAFVVPKEKVARLAQPFAIDKGTGRPITLLDVTVVQKNDAGGARHGRDDRRLRALRADAGERWSARGRPSPRPGDGELHDVGSSRHDQAGDRPAPARVRFRARLRGPQGDRRELRPRFRGRIQLGWRRGHRVLDRSEGSAHLRDHDADGAGTGATL